MDQFTKEGRKLRPRKTSSTPAARSERVEYHSSENSENRSYGEHRTYGENRSYGEHRTYGDRPRRNYGENRPYGDRPQRSYGDRPQRSNFSGNSDSERRPYGDRPHRSYGENRPHGEHQQRPYGDRPQRSYGDRPQRSNFSGNSDSERRPYGDRPHRSSFNSRPSGRPGFSNNGGKRPYGNRNSRPGFQKPYNKENSEGIERMISRRPVVNGAELSDNDVVETNISNEVRLNKFIANSGVCSRREADTLIQAGVVTVNGEVVTELGTKVNVFEDDIRFNGERLKGEEKVYIIMNKPKGFVTTASDPHAEKTVLDLLKGCETRVYPVGRLDKNTTGVLMFTNDGEIAERLTHPLYDKKKIYQVSLDRPLSKEDYDQIIAGVTLNDGEVKADELEYVDENDSRKLGIEIHSGKNRIVRRIFESLGYSVKALDRVYFAGLTKKGLKKGEWRYLTEGEVNILKMGAYV